ncbi:YcnI family copper-binding membrane protein [Actinacidiphila sp. ITFR-21]|uniref:YcnI family copper-binding membrane protein n=1 Tax=Actinacidiphila sp. ITFR-21 TaxID=3075199 RepID=UPI002889AA69|nr:YcnI family protein [Streptomyces sp. ITFR-21]WNI16542.1 YcnI family protein [Streptomyces sp. ITFR-21]
MSSSRMRGRAATVAALAGSAVLLAAVPAFAHVTVSPDAAGKGGYSTVSFKVPNEEDSASTVKVEVILPTDHPIASVSVQPVPGWTAQITTVKLATPVTTDDGTVDRAAARITWTGGKIAPGQFQQFPVSLGPLPTDTDSLSFKTLQTYSDGEVARWIEIPRPGRPEPQNPAPTLTLTAAADGAAAGTATAAGTPPAAPAADAGKPVAASDAVGGSDGTARALGIIGIVVGAIGVGFGVFAGRRRRPANAGAAGGPSEPAV